MRTTTAQIFKCIGLNLALITLLLAPLAIAQGAASVVPTLVNFSGSLTDLNGKAITGVAGVTFGLYKDQEGGAPLWIETQNVRPDKHGHYAVMLGSTKSDGLPTDLFVSGEARWLEVQAEGQAEQPRVMLLAVPYALKAGDAATVGGLPPSAFVLAPPSGVAPWAVSTAADTPGSGGAQPPAGPVTGTGTVSFVPLWDTTSDIVSSSIFQSGSGSTAKIGLGTQTPATTLDVKGASTIRGLLNLPAVGAATATAGFNSQAFNVAASAYNSGTGTAVNQNFRWQAEPVGNNTSTTSGTLNLLYASGSNAPAETGLKLSSAGLFTFATGQTFPGTGTITGVSAGTDLIGGGGTGNVTLNLDTTKVPRLAASNSFSGNQTITGNLSDTGNITASGSITGKTATFSGTNSTQVVNVTQSGTGYGVLATMPNAAASFIPAVLGNATNTSGYGVGVEGRTASVNGFGVYGWASNTTGGGYGIFGETDSFQGSAVYGFAGNTASGSFASGVTGSSYSLGGTGVTGYNVNGLANGIGVWGYAAGTGNGVRGNWGTSTIGSGFGEIGVWGDSGTGLGVLGSSDSYSGVYGLSDTYRGAEGYSNDGQAIFGYSTGSFGVEGVSPSLVGVYGIFFDSSNEGAGWSNVGTWGDSGISGSVGVLGTVDDGNALFGKNNTSNHETLYAENDSSTVGANAARFAGPGASTYCYVVRDSVGLGDIVCTGAKSAAVPVEGNRMVRLYAVEAADNWFEDAGTGQLSNGSATVAFDAAFAQTVNGDIDYHVFITPNGDCEGLFIAHKNGQGFEVHELRSGHSSIAFDYRIMAKRKGFENVHMQDVTADFAQMKSESDALAARLEAGKQAELAKPRSHVPTPMKRFPGSSPRVPSMPVIAHQNLPTGK